MAIDLQSINDDIHRLGDITLQPLYPKQWKQTIRLLSIALPGYPLTDSVEILVPENLPLTFKENLIALLQEVCYAHGLNAITVTEQGS